MNNTIGQEYHISKALQVDLYELTMSEIYFEKRLTGSSFWEVSIRNTPRNWGFFVMAGLDELFAFINSFSFGKEDIGYLKKSGLFSDGFLEYLMKKPLSCTVRALPEGTIFFAGEPIVEIDAPLITGQVLETSVLNILGSSIAFATLATRIKFTAHNATLLDFGLRRAQGPVAALRAARGAMIAGFSGTSNLYAAKELQFTASGTMAHSFIHSFETEEEAFWIFAQRYREKTILLVDTFDAIKGIHNAALVAENMLALSNPVQIKGIRIDSGNLVKLSRYAREHFDTNGLDFMKIYVSGLLDEYQILKLVSQNAPIDGYGVGSRFITSWQAAFFDIIYKPARIGNRNVSKKSPGKTTRGGRKTVIRKSGKGKYYQDMVTSFNKNIGHDLLKTYKPVQSEPVHVIQERLKGQLNLLDYKYKRIIEPEQYPVIFSND